ncbi:MAG: hypothetical protein QM771_08500 [Nitrospira sp.]
MSISELDYDSAGTSPLLALVGDSYIEGTHGSSGSTAAARLRRMVREKGRVYSFGTSGWL